MLGTLLFNVAELFFVALGFAVRFVEDIFG